TAFDIPSVLKFEAVGRLLGITMDGLGKVNILVREDDFERALEIISPEEDNPTEE
ncbi:MAG: DUF2007 domain-containing protein, partial [Candidatus Aminicenantes bacterium]|nr:DUF2007 domain-containing protein [Candidatus Aminicenantes bacterium]